MFAIKSKPMARRTLLRGGAAGASVAVGLPLFDAMLNDNGDALALGGPLPARFITWFFGAGFDIDRIEPRTANGVQINTADANSPHLTAFAGLEEYVTVCAGVNLPSGGIGDNHHIGRTGRFSAYKNIGSGTNTDWGGPTIDQEIADLIGETTVMAIPSMQVGISKFGATDGGDFGTTALNLSMRRGSAPGSLVELPPETNPFNVWNSLFSAVDVPPHEQSILDYISDDLTRLQGGLGQTDQVRLEAHLEAIRQVERRLLLMCPEEPAPTEDNSEPSASERIIEVNAVMADLIALAFECDITRVASVEFTRIAGDPEFWQQPGYEDGARQHDESHQADQSNYILGVEFTMNQLAAWLFRLRDGTSNLLDSTILYASSDCGWGQNHTQQRAPIILGGRGQKNGSPYLAPGQTYLQPGAPALGPTDPRNTASGAGNSSEILLSCLKAFDLNADRNTTVTVGDADVGATGIGIDQLVDASQP